MILETSGVPVFSPEGDTAGRFVGYRGIDRDISARKQAEADLRSRNAELEAFTRAAVGRELTMIRLKQQVNELASRLGEAPPYDLGFLDATEENTFGREQP